MSWTYSEQRLISLQNWDIEGRSLSATKSSQPYISLQNLDLGGRCLSFTRKYCCTPFLLGFLQTLSVSSANRIIYKPYQSVLQDLLTNPISQFCKSVLDWLCKTRDVWLVCTCGWFLDSRNNGCMCFHESIIVAFAAVTAVCLDCWGIALWM